MGIILLEALPERSQVASSVRPPAECVCMQLHAAGQVLLLGCLHAQPRHGLLVGPATRLSKNCLTSTTWLGAVGEPLPSSQMPLPAAAHVSSHTLTVSRTACSSQGNCPACSAAPCLAACVVPCCTAVLLLSRCCFAPMPACTCHLCT